MKATGSLITAFVVLSIGLFSGPLASQKAHSVPVSNQVIVMELTHPDGQVTKAAVREGAMFKVRDAEAGWYYGFTPVLDRPEEVLVTAFRITEGPGEHEMLQQRAQERAGIDEKDPTSISEGFSLRVLRVFEAPFEGTEEDEDR